MSVLCVPCHSTFLKSDSKYLSVHMCEVIEAEEVEQGGPEQVGEAASEVRPLTVGVLKWALY